MLADSSLLSAEQPYYDHANASWFADANYYAGADHDGNHVSRAQLQTIVRSTCVQHTFLQFDTSSGDFTPFREKWTRRAELGKGAFGVVYKETCKQTAGNGQPSVRAVKEIRSSKKSKTDPSNELEAITLFSDPQYADYFVRCLGWWQTPRAWYIAMEYLPLGDLQNCLQRGGSGSGTSRVTEDEVKTISQQLLAGLFCMHSNRFAHRDLKPRNILVVEQGPHWQVRISDFGISKRLADDYRGSVGKKGTVGYMAPELMGLIPGHEVADPYLCDMWSFGAILFFLLVGRKFFRTTDQLKAYAIGQTPLLSECEELVDLVSPAAIEVLEATMTPRVLERPTAGAAMHYSWYNPGTPTDDGQNEEDDEIGESAQLQPAPLPQIRIKTAKPLQQPSVTAFEEATTQIRGTADPTQTGTPDGEEASVMVSLQRTGPSCAFCHRTFALSDFAWEYGQIFHFHGSACRVAPNALICAPCVDARARREVLSTHPTSRHQSTLLVCDFCDGRIVSETATKHPAALSPAFSHPAFGPNFSFSSVPNWFIAGLAPELQYVHAALAYKEEIKRTSSADESQCSACGAWTARVDSNIGDMTEKSGSTGTNKSFSIRSRRLTRRISGTTATLIHGPHDPSSSPCSSCGAVQCPSCMGLLPEAGCQPEKPYCVVEDWIAYWRQQQHMDTYIGVEEYGTKRTGAFGAIGRAIGVLRGRGDVGWNPQRLSENTPAMVATPS